MYKRQTVHARFRALRALLNFLERRRKVDRADNPIHLVDACLLYTSDAADERSSVDLGGRRIIKKKINTTQR